MVGLADRAQVAVSRLNRLCDHQTCALSCGAAELVNRAVIAVAALRDFCGCNDGVSSTSRIGIVANALRNGCGISITDLINECRRKMPRLRPIAVVCIDALGKDRTSVVSGRRWPCRVYF